MTKIEELKQRLDEANAREEAARAAVAGAEKDALAALLDWAEAIRVELLAKAASQTR